LAFRKKTGSFFSFEEQQRVMNEICDIADSQNTDVVLVAGDLFDTFNPPVEAVDLLYKTLKDLLITETPCSCYCG
jgi:exonuclease SbcD